MAVYVLIDCHDQFLHVTKDTATETVLSQISKESLDHVQPRGAGGREVNVEPPVAGEPSFYLRVFVGGIVVHDQMQLLVLRCGVIEQTEELQPFLMPMPLLSSSPGRC